MDTMKIIYKSTSLKHSTADNDLWLKLADKLNIVITIIHRGTTNWLLVVDVQYSIICEGSEENITKFESLI